MADSVVLAAALRNNLLSLQNTQSLIDKTQLRLSTGLKVNSALDDPQNFFAARALNNRASDLTRLLDGIGQSIKTIETADKGITGLTKLVEQAQSVVNSARDELASSGGVARAVSNVDLSTTLITTLGGVAAGDTFTVSTVSDANTQISETITIQANDTVYNVAARIRDQFADNRSGEVTAYVTDEGFLTIESKGGRSFRITDSNVGAATEITNAGWTALGLDQYFEIESTGATSRSGATIVAGNKVESISLYESGGNIAEGGDLLTGTYLDEDGNTVLGNLAATDQLQIIVTTTTGATTASYTLAAGSTFQAFVDDINQDATVNQNVELGFDSDTGKLSITSLSDTVQNIQFTVVKTVAAAATVDIGLGDPSGKLDPINPTGAGTFERVIFFNSSTQALDSLADDYNTILDQIDQLVIDANYRGTNLLNGDQLTTYFNEDNSNSLTTTGVDFTANGLNLTTASFRSTSSIELNASQARSALEDVRSFGATLANNLAVIQIRQDFTKETVNTLKAGAEELTVADQNEEGANLLALQTRQALGVTALSLASQSQQSVLRLF